MLPIVLPPPDRSRLRKVQASDSKGCQVRQRRTVGQDRQLIDLSTPNDCAGYVAASGDSTIDNKSPGRRSTCMRQSGNVAASLFAAARIFGTWPTAV